MPSNVGRTAAILSLIGLVLWVMGYLGAFFNPNDITQVTVGLVTTTLGYFLLIYSMIWGYG